MKQTVHTFKYIFVFEVAGNGTFKPDLSQEPLQKICANFSSQVHCLVWGHLPVVCV